MDIVFKVDFFWNAIKRIDGILESGYFLKWAKTNDQDLLST